MKLMKSIGPLVFFVLCIMAITKSSAQEITVFPGFWSIEYYQDDRQITKNELKELLNKNEEVKAYWKKSKTNSGLAYAAIAGEFAFAIWTFSELDKDDTSNATAPAIGTLGFAVLAGIFINSANKNGKKAILTYNKQFDDKTSYSIVPMGNRDGLGLAIKW